MEKIILDNKLRSLLVKPTFDFPVSDWQTPSSRIPEQISPDGKLEIRHNIVKKDQTLRMSEKAIGKIGYAVAIKDYKITLLIETFDQTSKIPEYIRKELLHDDDREANRKYLVWMSDTPKEYFEMLNIVNRIPYSYSPKGKLLKKNVIIGGLGLGLLPNLLAMREDIRKIVAIEINESIIEMVKRYLSPKIEVINADFFEFLKLYGKKKMLLSKFFPLKKMNSGKKYAPEVDVIIVDIWSQYEQDNVLISLYLKSLDLVETYFPDTQHLFWDFEHFYDAHIFQSNNGGVKANE